MIHSFAQKSVVVIKPASVATNATSTGNIDRLGYDYAAIDIVLDSQSSTTSKPAVLKLSESDDTVATNFADITAFTGGTSTGNFTIPNASAAANIVRMNVDCRARKRYLKVSLTPGDAAQIACVTANLSRGKDAPLTATEHGVSALVTG